MKTRQLFLVYLWALLLLTLSAQGDGFFKTDDHSKADAIDLARQADARLQTASSPQDFQEVAALLEKAVRMDPDNLDIRQTLGWVYLDRLHEPQEAYRQLARVARERPDDVNARKLFGMACSQTGRSRKAVKEFRAASRLKPDDLWIRASLGRSLARTGHREEAEQIYEGILKVDPNNVDALLGEAEIEAWRGYSTVPLQTLDQLARDNPENADVRMLRGDIHRWNWDLTEAREDYEGVLKAEPNNYDARTGLEEAQKMGASDLHAKAYYFKDTTNFLREYVDVGGRAHLTDHVYLLAGGAAWRFTNPGVPDLNRGDGTAGFEFDFARWLSVTAVGNVFDYDNRPAFFGGRFSSKISPMTGTDLYASFAGNQPFVSSISTVQTGMREDSVGLGLDTILAGRFSFQTEAEGARLSDDNEWWEIKPQLSWHVFDKPATFLRVQYDYLDYSQTRTNYWTPQQRSTVGPVLDTSIPLCKGFDIVADGKAPYIFDESKFGYQVEGGPVIELYNRVQLKASYYYSSIPGDQGAWSGHGWQASVQFRF